MARSLSRLKHVFGLEKGQIRIQSFLNNKKLIKQVHALAHLFKFIIYYNNIYIRKEMPIQFNLI